MIYSIDYLGDLQIAYNSDLYESKEDAIIKMIATSKTWLKNDWNKELTLQFDHHDLDGYLIAIRFFKNRSSIGLLQLREHKLIKNRSSNNGRTF